MSGLSTLDFDTLDEARLWDLEFRDSALLAFLLIKNREKIISTLNAIIIYINTSVDKRNKIKHEIPL